MVAREWGEGNEMAGGETRVKYVMERMLIVVRAISEYFYDRPRSYSTLNKHQ